jgi:hypothetical protein
MLGGGGGGEVRSRDRKVVGLKNTYGIFEFYKRLHQSV